MKKTLKFILASGSPRRQEYIKLLNIPFEIIKPSIEEHSICRDPREVVEDLAKQKAMAVWQRELNLDEVELGKKRKETNPKLETLVLAADTLVHYDGELYGKPGNREKAKETLLKLSGKTHQVMSGVCLISSKGMKVFSTSSDVSFVNLSEEMLDHYLDTEKPYDYAGSYSIDGLGQIFVKSCSGSYSGVVGLPMAEVTAELQIIFAELGINGLF